MKINSYTPYDLEPSKGRTLNKDDAVLTSKPESLKNFTLIEREEANIRRPDNSPENLYAEVKVNGEVVATIWKTGLAQVPNKYAGILNEISNKYDTAYERTNALAKALDGKVSYYKEDVASYSFSDSLSKILSSNKYL